jgi:hypothetical protein
MTLIQNLRTMAMLFTKPPLPNYVRGTLFFELENYMNKNIGYHILVVEYKTQFNWFYNRIMFIIKTKI